jgi:hypothetical protein
MRRIVAVMLMAAHMAASVASEHPGQSQPQAPSPLLSKLTDEVIKQAVRETIAETVAKERTNESPALSGDRYEKFSREFSEAQVPDCLRPDGLKHQPTGFEVKGWGYIGVGGLFAAPFVAIAKLRGKCH